MNIRTATPNDLDALVGLNRDVQELHASLLPSVFKSAQDQDLKSGLATFVADEQFHTFLIEENGDAIGYIIAEVCHRDENAFKLSCDYLLIHQIMVAPDNRRRGVGTALLNEVRRLAQQAGLTRLQIDVYTANHEAKAFYASRGFGTVREFMEKTL